MLDVLFVGEPQTQAKVHYAFPEKSEPFFCFLWIGEDDRYDGGDGYPAAEEEY